MKRTLCILLIALAPVLTWADFQLGGIGLYNGNVAALGSGSISANDFSFGLETRFKFLSVLQVGLTGLYYLPSSPTTPSYIEALTDAGLSVDIFVLRLGAGIGPVFFIPMSGPAVAASSVANLKLSADINIGPVSIGVAAFYPVQSIWDLRNVPSMTPWVGITALIRLF